MWYILLSIICLGLFYYFKNPSTTTLYFNYNGEIIKVVDVYKNTITICHVRTTEYNHMSHSYNFDYITGPQNISRSEFKIHYLPWMKI